MFFIASKLLIAFTEPLVYILGLLLAALLWHRHPHVVKWTLSGALLLFLICGTVFLPQILNHWLETRYPQPRPLPHVDAVIVLCGPVVLEKSSGEYIEFNQHVERILEGIRLVQAGYGKKLLITGGSGDVYDQTKSEAVLLRQFAIRLGIPAEQILIDATSRNTYENAVNTKKLMEQHQFFTSLLVTSASHLPRAMGCFRKLGLTPFPYPVDFASLPHPQWHLLDLIPNIGNLYRTSEALHEYVGLFTYKLAGYL
jgi:uncharacterized SAM-binding protein YcdF (DUF218 family)